MLIGEAFRDCIHPHADAIYRSAADVLVSPSLDDEINKLCRTTQRCAELQCPTVQEGRGRLQPAPDNETAVRAMPRHSASWRLLRWLASFEDGLTGIRTRTRPDPTPAD